VGRIRLDSLLFGPRSSILAAMPALLLHLTLGRQAAEQAGIPEAVARAAEASPGALLLGSILPDLPYHFKFGRQLLRHLTRRAYLHSEWGDLLHTRGTGRLALALLAHIRRSFPGPRERQQLLALAAGYISHHAVDRTCHPVVQQVVRQRLQAGEHHNVMHSRVERYQSLIYHHDLLGYDIAGTPFGARLLRQTAGTGLLRPRLPEPLWLALRASCIETHGRVPAAAEVRDWLWGITAYGAVFSSPSGRMERLHGDLDQLRQTWYQGPGIDLLTPIHRAQEVTRDCWQAAMQVLDAGQLTGEVRRAFLQQVPDIDMGTGY
jgi:hypothetical protein